MLAAGMNINESKRHGQSRKTARARDNSRNSCIEREAADWRIIMITQFNRRSLLDVEIEGSILEIARGINSNIIAVDMERRFLLESEKSLTRKETSKVRRILGVPSERSRLKSRSTFSGSDHVIEIGTRIERVTPESTNSVSIFRSCGIDSVIRCEENKRYRIKLSRGSEFTGIQRKQLVDLLHDRMTQQPYDTVPDSFQHDIVPVPVQIYDVIRKGPAEVDRACRDMGLSAFRPEIKRYFCRYFVSTARRNPTGPEIFMFAQLNSNHCRHFNFGAIYVIDGKVMQLSPFDLIKSTYYENHGNVVLAFVDNAGATAAVPVKIMMPEDPINPSPLRMYEIDSCVILKVETHNHPSAISPYEGSATGMAVIRDAFGTGRGGVPVFQFSGICVGQLRLSGLRFPWEMDIAAHPGNLATPLKIAIRGTDGASDNCNEKGLPIIMGFFRSFGLMVGTDHYEWKKCVMVAGVGGYLDKRHLYDREIKAGDLMMMTGGDAYPIGVAGGSGSSIGAGVQSKKEEFESVQRANGAMERGNYEVVRALSEMRARNIVKKVTDLGAGGIICAGPESVHNKATKTGARIEIRQIPCGDKTMRVYVYVGNEAQERMVFIIAREDKEIFEQICKRYRCPFSEIGVVTDDGRFIMTDRDAINGAPKEQKVPINVEMSFLLSDLPQITIKDRRIRRRLGRFRLSPDIHSFRDALWWVLRHPDVASKTWITQKGDRSVGGKVAQQQCVGPLQLPLADCAVTAKGFYQNNGDAHSIGEMPIVGLVNTRAGGKMSFGEAITNIMWAAIGNRRKISVSATWQWPCGQPGEDARLYDTVEAVAKPLRRKLKIPIFVGKDSTSMYAVSDGHVIKAPGSVQICATAPCYDIRKTVTPDIKKPGKSKLMFIDFAKGKMRLGGSMIVRICGQIGKVAPDMNADLLIKGYNAIQHLIKRDLILAGHDRSDGGLITCILEMAFSCNSGLKITCDRSDVWGKDVYKALFNQELGCVIEYDPEKEAAIRGILYRHGLDSCYHIIGETTRSKKVTVSFAGKQILKESIADLRDWWFETSSRMSQQQSNPECAIEHRETLRISKGLKLNLSFRPTAPMILDRLIDKPAAAVVIEEGANGQDELANALIVAGLNAQKVPIVDIIDRKVSTDDFRWLSFPGGFTFKDTFGAGVGLGSEIMMHTVLSEELSRFYIRPDTLSWCPCNGFQASTLIGWVPFYGLDPAKRPRLVLNKSRMFESGYVQVRILPSPASKTFFKDMDNSVIGVWVAHREGFTYFPDKSVFSKVIRRKLVPMAYADDNGQPTERYPDNPNGSPKGITALCSEDGRHVGLMPHLERGFRKWQCPHKSATFNRLKAAPSLKMFENGRDWLLAN